MKNDADPIEDSYLQTKLQSYPIIVPGYLPER